MYFIIFQHKHTRCLREIFGDLFLCIKFFFCSKKEVSTFKIPTLVSHHSHVAGFATFDIDESLASILAHFYLKFYEGAKTTAIWTEEVSLTIFHDSLLKLSWIVVKCGSFYLKKWYQKLTLAVSQKCYIFCHLDSFIIHGTVRAQHLTAIQTLDIDSVFSTFLSEQ